MIDRIRLEGHGDTKEALEKELSGRVVGLVDVIRRNGDKRCGRWETTDDVVTLNRTQSGFVGRKVMKFKQMADEHDWDEGYMQRLCRICGRVEAT